MLMTMYWRIKGERVLVKVCIAYSPNETPELVGELNLSVRQFIDLSRLNVQPDFVEEQ